jgi:hypothetical protein
MIGRHLFLALRTVLSLIAVAAFLFIPGCYEEEVSSKGTTVNSPAQTTAAPVKALPKRGKQKLAAAPAYAVFGMIYVNTTENREYIYDGAQWVPHDQTVDAYYETIASRKTRLALSQVIPTGTTPIPDVPGGHGLPGHVSGGPTKHGGYECKVCHYVGGVLMFDPNGPAVGQGKPLPTFDATNKTCSNVACHGVPSGTFSYYFPGNEMDEDGYPIPDLKTVNVLGNSGGTTPSWYATGSVACSACHANPPRFGTDGSNAWHSGYHANNQNVGPTQPNACELCHNRLNTNNTYSAIAQSSGVGAATVGTAILIPGLHGNGVFDVVARFRQQCFGCH